MTRVLTVGHSSHDVDDFISLLQRHEVTAVADVRSAPFSQFAPQFNQARLKERLVKAGIGYVFLGEQLGARSRDRSCYVDGRVQYDRLAQTEGFKEGLERLLSGLEAERVAVMCTEKDPLDCHRTLLVARALIDRGVEVGHILSDGRLETDDEAMHRLLRQQDLEQPELLRSLDERLSAAIQLQEQQIAYVDEALAAEAPEGT